MGWIIFGIGSLVGIFLIKKATLDRARGLIAIVFGGGPIAAGVTSFIQAHHIVGPYQIVRMGTNEVVGYGNAMPLSLLQLRFIYLLVWGCFAFAGWQWWRMNRKT